MTNGVSGVTRLRCKPGSGIPSATALKKPAMALKDALPPMSRVLVTLQAHYNEMMLLKLPPVGLTYMSTKSNRAVMRSWSVDCSTCDVFVAGSWLSLIAVTPVSYS